MTDLRIPDISRRGLLKATGLAAGLVLSAVLFAVTGELAAAAFFFVTGLVQLTLSAVTRYTAGPATPTFLP